MPLTPGKSKAETKNLAHERKEVRLLDEMKAMHKGIGKGACAKCGGKVGKGHACGASMKKVGKGQDEFEQSRDVWRDDKGYKTIEDRADESKKTEEPFGSGQAKRVGKGQSKAAPDKMPKRSKSGAQPLPVAKKAVSRRHRPPMNSKPPGMPAPGMPAPSMPGGPMGPSGISMPPPPGATPAMPGVTPGMPPQRPPMGMGQSRKRG